MSKRTALILTVSPWDEPKRLRKQLAELLEQEMDVVYVTLPYGFRKPSRTSVRQDGGVTVVSIAGPWLPLRHLMQWRPVRALYERYVAFRLSRNLGSRGRTDSVLCFTPSYPRVLECFGQAARVYVSNDDHAAQTTDPQEAERLAKDENETVALCSRVICVSNVLAERLARHRKPIHVVYPGHNCSPLPFQRFSQDSRVRHSACFLGYIDWRVDFDLLAFLLEKGMHIALIGPVIGREQEVNALRARFPGYFEIREAIEAEDAPALLASYEVLTIPYRFKSEHQAATLEMPNKIFVYFAALRPIVTTYLPNLQCVEPGLIYRSRTREEFYENCMRAIREDSPEYASLRSRLTEQNTWEHRRQTLVTLLT